MKWLNEKIAWESSVGAVTPPTVLWRICSSSDQKDSEAKSRQAVELLMKEVLWGLRGWTFNLSLCPAACQCVDLMSSHWKQKCGEDSVGCCVLHLKVPQAPGGKEKLSECIRETIQWLWAWVLQLDSPSSSPFSAGGCIISDKSHNFMPCLNFTSR